MYLLFQPLWDACLSSFEDSDNLAKQMIRLIEDKQLYNHLSENGVRVIADSFTSTKVFEKLDGIYQAMV